MAKEKNKKVLDKPFKKCYNKYVKKTNKQFTRKKRGINYGKQNN